MTSSEPEGSSILDIRYLRIAGVCVALMALSYLLARAGTAIPRAYFLPLHLVLEYSSIVVSFAVFATGWYGYRQTRDARDLVVGVTFMLAGAFDFVHTLSYEGMPDFLGMNSVGKAEAYWLLARLTVGVGLLGASFVRPDTRSRWLAPGCLAGLSGAVVIAVVALITVFGSTVGGALYDWKDRSLTGLKKILELLSVTIYAAAFWAISEKRGWERGTVASLRSALVLAAFAGICFILYLSPYDWINALGHVFKIAAYYFILRALFVSAIQRPHDELSRAKEELETLYTDARNHRKEIEMCFQRIGSALSSSLRLDEALDRISELAADMLHADSSIVVSSDKRAGGVRVSAQKGGCDEARHPMELTLEIGKRAIEQRTTINDIESARLVECSFAHETCLRSMVCAPMMFEGEAMGVISIYSHNREAFEEGDAKLLEAFASHAAVAVHNAVSYEHESHIADVLQRSILTPTEVKSGRFEIAQVYEPAMNEALVGGDFSDVIRMAGGRIGLVIGDVSGKGLKAAVHTAMAKYSLRAFVNEGHSPAMIMSLLNRAVVDLTDEETFITLFVGLLDPEMGEMVYASAGHEPAMYWRGGIVIALPPTGPALGLRADMEFEEKVFVLEPESVLLLYTDGISEARKGNVFWGAEGVSEHLRVCRKVESGDVAKCIHQAAIEFAEGPLKDDVAVLAVKAGPSPAPTYSI